MQTLTGESRLNRPSPLTLDPQIRAPGFEPNKRFGFQPMPDDGSSGNGFSRPDSCGYYDFGHSSMAQSPAWMRAPPPILPVRRLPIRRVVKFDFCVFCKNNGEDESYYLEHTLKDDLGNVTCPVLFAYTCPLCGATGSVAHTIKYCPKNKDNLYTNEMASITHLKQMRTSTGNRRQEPMSSYYRSAGPGLLGNNPGLSPNHGFSSSNHGCLSPNHGFSSPNQGFSSHNQGLLGSSSGIISPPFTPNYYSAASSASSSSSSMTLQGNPGFFHN